MIKKIIIYTTPTMEKYKQFIIDYISKIKDEKGIKVETRVNYEDDKFKITDIGDKLDKFEFITYLISSKSIQIFTYNIERLINNNIKVEIDLQYTNEFMYLKLEKYVDCFDQPVTNTKIYSLMYRFMEYTETGNVWIPDMIESGTNKYPQFITYTDNYLKEYYFVAMIITSDCTKFNIIDLENNHKIISLCIFNKSPNWYNSEYIWDNRNTDKLILEFKHYNSKIKNNIINGIPIHNKLLVNDIITNLNQEILINKIYPTLYDIIYEDNLQDYDVRCIPKDELKYKTSLFRSSLPKI